jgi:hypothetical protein
MNEEFSTPLVELPSFLSTISMVGDDESAIIQKLVHAERKSPSVYAPSRDLFLAALEGKLNFEDVMRQAWNLSDEIQRKSAVSVLSTSKTFLSRERSVHISSVQKLEFSLPNGMPLDVTPVWLQQSNPPKLMILHFWRTPLSQWQLSAAAAVLKSTIRNQLPQLEACDIDFISVSFAQGSNSREFQRLNWTKLKPLNQVDLDRFWNYFLVAWSQYQRKAPRKIRRRKTPTLFG